jgi:predicted choloylglycine hydrolase
MQLTFEAINEPLPGPAWQAHFRRLWPGYRRWFLSRGGHRGPSLAESERALRRHMPEMLPVWERLVSLAGDDALAARFLTGWCPPRYLAACSQAACRAGDGVWLVRNYDLDPGLNEALLWRTAWTGRGAISTGECLAGAADGLNEAGLAVSLAFGGRRVYGEGFGVPFVVRYLLEVAGSTAEAADILQRVPVHMAYNVTLADRSGDLRTLMLGPDRRPETAALPLATNHQDADAWPELVRFSRSIERAEHLRQLLTGEDLDGEALIDAFLRSPLYTSDHGRGFGTVYTAAWRPDRGEVMLAWPDARWAQGLGCFVPGRREVRYPPTTASISTAAGDWSRFVPPPFRRYLRSPLGASA